MAAQVHADLLSLPSAHPEAIMPSAAIARGDGDGVRVRQTLEMCEMELSLCQWQVPIRRRLAVRP